MVKSELITLLTEKYNKIPRNEIEIIVNAIFNTITKALVRGERVEIRGFGSFQSRIRKARQGVNPKTGSTVSISQRRAPFFKVGKDLKERVDS